MSGVTGDNGELQPMDAATPAAPAPTWNSRCCHAAAVGNSEETAALHPTHFR